MKIINTAQFLSEIESLRCNGHIEYIDAIVHWCAKNNVEIEYAASLVKKDQVLKSKLQVEAEELNFVKKSAKLPF